MCSVSARVRFSVKPAWADVWGYEVNIYNVPDLESFLRAVLLLPRSITSDFNFPLWRYYGRGSGASGEHHEYSLRRQLTRLSR